MPNKGKDGYTSVVRGKDIGVDLLKEVEEMGAREASIPRSAVNEPEVAEEEKSGWQTGDWSPEPWMEWKDEKAGKAPMESSFQSREPSSSVDWYEHNPETKPPRAEPIRGGWSNKGSSQPRKGEVVWSTSWNWTDGAYKEKERGLQKESVDSAETRIRKGAVENCYKALHDQRIGGGEEKPSLSKEKVEEMVKTVWEDNKKMPFGKSRGDSVMKDVMRKITELEAEEKYQKDLLQAIKESSDEAKGKASKASGKEDKYVSKGEKEKGKRVEETAGKGVSSAGKGVSPVGKGLPSAGKTYTTEGGESSCGMLNYMSAQCEDTGGEIFGKWMTNVEHLKTEDHKQDLLNLLMRKFAEHAIDYQYGSQMTLAIEEFASAMRAWSKLPHLSYYSVVELVSEQPSFSIGSSKTGKSLMISLCKETHLYSEFCKVVRDFLSQGRRVSDVPIEQMKAVWAQHEAVPYVPYQIAFEGGNMWFVMTTVVGLDPIEYPKTAELREKGLLPQRK